MKKENEELKTNPFFNRLSMIGRRKQKSLHNVGDVSPKPGTTNTNPLAFDF